MILDSTGAISVARFAGLGSLVGVIPGLHSLRSLTGATFCRRYAAVDADLWNEPMLFHEL